MDILINWVTQIIIFLVLASLIDLLLPSNSMKKYIQFVIGLILILIFLKPVLYIFNIDIKQTLETTFGQTTELEENTETMGDLIKKQKNEIESSQDAYILKEMVVQLEELAADPLAETFETEIVDIQFVFDPPEEAVWENLQEVTVYLAELQEEEDAVDEIEDIVIDTEETPEEKIQDDNHDEIKTMLQDLWELDDIQLTIIQEGGAF